MSCWAWKKNRTCKHLLICPECGKEMKEEFGCVSDSDNDEIYDVMMGYICECGLKIDTNGEVVE